MKARLTQTYVNSIKLPEKPYWITDTGCSKLRLYVGTVKKVWYVGYRDSKGTYANYKLGAADALTVAQARDMTLDFTARLIRGEMPQKKTSSNNISLGDFIECYYKPWVTVERKTGDKTLNLLVSTFRRFLNKPIDELTVKEMEKWRHEKIALGLKAASCNRQLTALKAVLNWGVKREYFEFNPLARLDRLTEHDSDIKVRYLTDDERMRLMVALDAREKRMREERESHNRWLVERGRPPMPELGGSFADYLKPMVLVSLNSGIRRGTLFALKWKDIDFSTRTMTLRAIAMKSGKTTCLPLNSIVAKTLLQWRDQCPKAQNEDLIFPSPVSGKMLNNVKKSWTAILKDASIENFRWHDMRHDFASRLVMQGVDLNVVRELLGHADLKMTMRYAHLAPSIKLQAVELLVQ
mgnify:CR=1 FL=1